MPFTALLTLFGHFPLGPYACFIWNCLDFTAGTTSMLHLGLISFDRYLSVSKPIKYTNKQRTDNRFSVHGLPTTLILIFIWFFSCTAWIPVLLYFKSTEPNQSLIINECSINGSPLIILPHSFIVYYLPMFLIVFFYTKTIKKVNEKMKRRRFSTVLNQQLQQENNTKFCCFIREEKRRRRRKESLLTKDTEMSKISKSETMTNLIRIDDQVTQVPFLRQFRSISLENNLNRSLENSKHLNNLYHLKNSLNRTYNSSLNLSNTKDEILNKGILKKPLSVVCNLNKNLSFKVNKSTQIVQTKRIKTKLKLSLKSNRSSNNLLAKKEKNVTYKLGFIMVTFIISWLPFCVLWSLNSLCKWKLCFISDNLYIFSFWLAYLNSIFTPFILLLNNNKYRKSINLIWNFLCCRKNPRINFHINNNKNFRNRIENKKQNMRLNCSDSPKKDNQFSINNNYSYAEINSLRKSSLQ
ncbi:unnamed protein product [Brachionus calyciflorus]|nr:unnamed protein product [Brachionus calyciflorus]